MGKGDKLTVNIWFLAGLVSLLSGVVLILAKYVMEREGVPLWAIILLLIFAAAGFILSDVYAHIVNVPEEEIPSKKSKSEPESTLDISTPEDPDLENAVFEEAVAETEE